MLKSIRETKLANSIFAAPNAITESWLIGIFGKIENLYKFLLSKQKSINFLIPSTVSFPSHWKITADGAVLMSDMQLREK